MKYQEVLKLCALAAVVVWLAGSVQAQSMIVALSSNGSLPASDPYCGQYPGAVTTVAKTDVGTTTPGGCVPVTLDQAPNFTGQDAGDNTVGVVDWILVEVRAAAAGTEPGGFVDLTVTVQIPALVLSNGVVVDAEIFAGLDDSAKILCATAGNRCDAADVAVPAAAFPTDAVTNVPYNVHVVIRHRNHLDIMSAQPVADEGGVRAVDFTTVTSVYSLPGGPTVWTSDVAPAALAKYTGSAFMVPGDSDASGRVSLADLRGEFGLLTEFGRNTRPGYRLADTNFDTRLSLTDLRVGILASFASNVTQSRVPSRSSR